MTQGIQETSKVYFTDARASSKNSLVEKIARLVKKGSLFEGIQADKRIALKMSFGERGSSAYIRTPFIRKIVDLIKEKNAIPFVTDANTLYTHKRNNAIDHLETANINGFNYASLGAPVIIADGLCGADHVPYKINGKYFNEIYIASAVYHSDFIVSAAHFTGHMACGFGASIKNIAMGCASIKGKYYQHSEMEPAVKKALCRLCGKCIETCGYKAIVKEKDSLKIILDNCVGCGECVSVCPYGAMSSKFGQSKKILQEKMIEYLKGITLQKKDRIVYINFLLDITPDCDCPSFSDSPIVPDIGILASEDPIALDKASVDMVNQVSPISLSKMEDKLGAADKIDAIHKGTDWMHQILYGKEAGLGNVGYEIISI